ncbi:MAG: zf-HC2 domain-containing protein [Nitrospirae bacterium]|nr:zf-HC2 domain-containing protein [Nitrospirota bacterium]
MSNCKAVREMLSEYMDERLDGASLEAVKGHLAHCPQCAAQLRSLQNVAEAMRGLVPVNAPADFAQRLKERIDERPRSFFELIPLGFKIPAGVTALIITAVVALYVFKSDQVIPLMNNKKAETVAVPPASDAHTDTLTAPAKAPAAAAPKKKAAEVQLQAQAIHHPQAVNQPKQVHKMNKNMEPAKKESPVQNEDPVLIALLIKTAPEPPASVSEAAPAPPPASELDKAESSAERTHEAAKPAGALNRLEGQNKEAAPAQRSKLKAAFSKEGSDDLSDSREHHEQSGSARPTQVLAKKDTINPLDSALTKIVDCLPGLGAKMAAPQVGHRLLIDIPAENYDSFLRQLQSIGVYTAPPPQQPGLKTIRIQIQLTSE